MATVPAGPPTCRGQIAFNSDHRQLSLYQVLREDIAMRALRIQKRLYARRSAANHDL
jgi:hypothetical protein